MEPEKESLLSELIDGIILSGKFIQSNLTSISKKIIRKFDIKFEANKNDRVFKLLEKGRKKLGKLISFYYSDRKRRKYQRLLYEFTISKTKRALDEYRHSLNKKINSHDSRHIYLLAEKFLGSSAKELAQIVLNARRDQIIKEKTLETKKILHQNLSDHQGQIEDSQENFHGNLLFKNNEQQRRWMSNANKPLKRWKKKEIKEEWLKAFDEKFQEMKNKHLSVTRMYNEMVCSIGRDINIKRTTFYKYFMKSRGYRFRKLKLRFGEQNGARRIESRRMTSQMLAKTTTDGKLIHYFDECTFATKEFDQKYWTRKDLSEKIEIKHVLVSLKMMSLISSGKVVAFRLTSSGTTQHEIFEFLLSAVVEEQKKLPSGAEITIVLDNNPKNKGKMVESLLRLNNLSLFYTTPNTPEQNMCENYFCAVKRFFSNLKNLSLINEARKPKEVLMRQVISAISQVEPRDWRNIQASHLQGLASTL